MNTILLLGLLFLVLTVLGHAMGGAYGGPVRANKAAVDILTSVVAFGLLLSVIVYIGAALINL